MGVQRHAPAALPQGKTRYALYKRLGGPPSRSVQVRMMSSPPGFDLRSVHPVASRYTAYAIPAPVVRSNDNKSDVELDMYAVRKYAL
jgi:hypothetical protein